MLAGVLHQSSPLLGTPRRRLSHRPGRLPDSPVARQCRAHRVRLCLQQPLLLPQFGGKLRQQGWPTACALLSR